MTGSERRQVTVFFSDLCGYTPLSEQLEPEDVRETMDRVFAAAARVVDGYGGRIDKLLGDGVLAVFGDPVGHEDDPERAVRAVLDLHTAVGEISRDVAPSIGREIAMHTGIASGVVVTGRPTDDAVTAGPLGDPVNVASRLESIAAPGQILIAPETHRLTAGTFDVKHLGPRQLKGKAQPVDVTEVVGIAAERTRPSRVRGEFVGRQEELGILLAAVERLRDGTPSVISVCAEAGAGKTRLIEEFRSRLPEDVAWIEGRAYPYGQNIPYSAVIDLLNGVLGIDEGDTSDTLAQKLTQGVHALMGADEGVLAPLAALYALELPGLPPIDREAYQPALVRAVNRLIDMQSRTQPTVICLQDLHWADPSTVAMLREVAAGLTSPVVFVCNFRPEFSLGASGERALELDELSGRQSAQLVASLLGDSTPPDELTGFIEKLTDGNPFFIEEIINRLIETDALVRTNGSWSLAHALDRIDMPSTIRGVIQARIDHLDVDQRRLLREASVVGRAFLYRVVSRVCSNTDDLDLGLSELETADLIRQRTLDPDLEYFFKHALTQEVAYDGLVRRERQDLHGRVADAIESMLADRAGEFVETLAFHYVRAGNTAKAVEYLIESGRKCLARYALSEAAIYFADAHVLLGAQERTSDTRRALAQLVIEWSLLYYYDGSIIEWLALLRAHLTDAEECGDERVLSMYLGWLGNAQFLRGEMDESLTNLQRALRLAETAGDEDAASYARAWLVFTLEEPGNVRAAIELGRSTTYRPELLRRDPYPWIKGQGGLAVAAMAAGELRLLRETADELIAFGRETGNARAEVFGQMASAGYWLLTLDHERAVESSRSALDVARDPIYSAFAAYTYAASAAAKLDFALARTVIDEWLPKAEAGGNAFARQGLSFFDGLIKMDGGDYSRGLRQALDARDQMRRCGYAITATYADLALAFVYSMVARRAGTPPTVVGLARNPAFLVAHAVPARRKAHRLFDVVRRRGIDNGWLGVLGRAWFFEAELYAYEGDLIAASRCIEEMHRFYSASGVQSLPPSVADLEATLS